MSGWRVIEGDCREVLRELEPESVQCCVTSPPYFRQRQTGLDGEVGRETNPSEYASAIVAAMRDVRRAMARSGSLWLNIGDSYAVSGRGGGGLRAGRSLAHWSEATSDRRPPAGFKRKDLLLVPTTVAGALCADGWYLRKTIIWAKPSATEPPRVDRPSCAHEYLFLLTRSEHSAVRDPGEKWWRTSVWPIASESVPAHGSVMPRELARRCILAGCPEGGTVLDPFAGAGTTGLVATRLHRAFVGIELNPTYAEMARQRIRDDAPLLNDVGNEAA